MIYSVLVFALVLIAIMLIGIILVQSGQGDMGAAMGGNTMNQAFGSQGADKLLVRITTALATIFMVLAISIQLVGKNNSSTLLEELPNKNQDEDLKGLSISKDSEESIPVFELDSSNQNN